MICGSVAASAQAVAPAQTAPARIGFVNSAQFSRATGGINRFVAVIRTLDAEFKVRRDEIAAGIARLEALQKEPPANTPQAQRAAQLEQAQTLQIEVSRKQEDARVAYARRFTQMADPLQKTIVDSLIAFAKARGVDVLIDVSKFPEGVLVINPTSDITAAFIRDFNTKNP
jgi:Skp family chaperone for outer membrane proteins